MALAARWRRSLMRFPLFPSRVSAEPPCEGAVEATLLFGSHGMLGVHRLSSGEHWERPQPTEDLGQAFDARTCSPRNHPAVAPGELTVAPGVDAPNMLPGGHRLLDDAAVVGHRKALL